MAAINGHEENLMVKLGWADAEIFNTDISDGAWFYTLTSTVGMYNDKHGTSFEECATVHKYLRRKGKK